jgi:hypothetical protein
MSNIHEQNLLNDDIRETFYNTIICVAFENNIGANELNGLNRLQLLSNIICTSLKRIRETSKIGFYTIKGKHITANNVPEYFKELYVALEQTKNITDINLLYSVLKKITISIMNKNSFSNIINQVIDFYREASGQPQNIQQEKINTQNAQNSNHELKRYIRNPNIDPMIENIRQTFYDTMMIAVQHDSDIIPHQDIIDFEPYIAIGMPALSIIYNILYSLEINGIKLLSGHIITIQNCPIYKDLFKKLFEVKQLIRNKNLTENEIILLKYKCVNNPSLQISPELEQYNSHELMSIVSKIVDIALDVSKLYDFKKNLGQFMK